PVGGDRCIETPLGELANMPAESGDGIDQSAAEQQTGEHRDAACADYQNDDAEQDGAQRGLADALYLAEGRLVQLVSQFSHLVAGVAIDTAQSAVGGHGVPVAVDELRKAVTVTFPELLMRAAQRSDSGLHIWADVQHADLLQQPLDLGLTALELSPIAVQISLTGTSQQDVLPLLYLFPEGQIGLTDLFCGGYGTFDQQTIVAQFVGQDQHAGNGKHQHQHQAADQQRQALHSQ